MAARAALLRTIYRAGYWILSAYWLVARPLKRGVVGVLTRGDEVLLVRHTYGKRRQWDLPGGGLRRGEEPVDGVRREIREELGVEMPDPVFLGELFERIGGKHDQLWCFAQDVGGQELQLNRAEIAETRWFPLDDLPVRRAKYAERIVGRLRAVQRNRRDDHVDRDQR